MTVLSMAIRDRMCQCTFSITHGMVQFATITSHAPSGGQRPTSTAWPRPPPAESQPPQSCSSHGAHTRPVRAGGDKICAWLVLKDCTTVPKSDKSR